MVKCPKSVALSGRSLLILDLVTCGVIVVVIGMTGTSGWAAQVLGPLMIIV